MVRITRTIRNVTKYGKVFTNELIIMPIYDKKEGEIVALLGVLQSVKNDEECVYNTKIDEIPLHEGVNGIIAWDKSDPKSAMNLVITNPSEQYEIIWVNENWSTLTGYRSSDAIGRTSRILQMWAIYDHIYKDENKEIVRGMMKELRGAIAPL